MHTYYLESGKIMFTQFTTSLICIPFQSLDATTRCFESILIYSRRNGTAKILNSLAYLCQTGHKTLA